VGERVWDASVKGTPIDDIDLVKLANGTSFTAVTVKAIVVCVDGFITINLLDNMPIADFPTLGAIEINQLRTPISLPVRAPTNPPAVPTVTVQAPAIPTAPIKTPTTAAAPVRTPAVPTTAPIRPTFEPILINCGGGAYTDKRRRVWMADKFNEGGTLFSTNKDILGTEDDELYQYHRWGQLTYNIPAPVGTYKVILHSAEI
jgi:Malectin domain